MRILAHRGSPATGTAENTVPAVSAALAAGADGVEVDLRLTADGVLAVCHDADLARLTGRPLPVHRSPWGVLVTAAAAHSVPLARVEWVLAAAAGRPVVLELKPTPVPRARVVAVLAERLAGLAAAGLPTSVTVSSRDAALMRAVRAAVPPPVRTALLGLPGQDPAGVLRRAARCGHDEIHPYVEDLLQRPAAVAEAAAYGVGVVPWTVNSDRALRRCADLGVAGVITDVPHAARLASRRRRALA